MGGEVPGERIHAARLRSAWLVGRKPSTVVLPPSAVEFGASGREFVERNRIPAAAFSADTWTCEVRPIVDRKIGRWCLDFIPTLDRSFHGPEIKQGVVLPQFQVQLRLYKNNCGRP